MSSKKVIEDFLEVSRIGLSLKETLPGDDLRALSIFMNLEDTLDKCRMYTKPDNAYEQIQLRELIENMDSLRSHIRQIMDAQDPEELRNFMIDRGRAAQNQFSLSI
jgi:hypothetical protein